MKKLFYLLAAVAVVAFVGCDKDDSKNGGLAGTTWVWSDSDSWGWERETISFQKNGKVTLLYEEEFQGEYDSYEYTGTYSYNEPNVTLTLSNYGEQHTLTGTVSGNQLRLYEDGDYYETYTRK